MDTARNLRAAVMAPAKLADTQTATKSPCQLACSFMLEPKATIERPKKTPIIVKTILRVIGSPKNNRLNMAAKTGIDAMIKTTFATLVSLMAKTKLHRTWGDAYGHMMVAIGRADIMFDPVLNLWDAAALLPVVKEAGGVFSDIHGVETIHSGNGYSTNPHLHPELKALFARHRAQKGE